VPAHAQTQKRKWRWLYFGGICELGLDR
jgi:hypothetical protein